MNKLQHTLNSISEASWLDKVSGFLDKVDPDRTKMRALAKTALAFAGGGELDDKLELIKSRRSEIDPEIKEDILRDFTKSIGSTRNEINRFLRLPPKEQTAKVKKALADAIKKNRVGFAQARRLERELYKDIKDKLWQNFKVDLQEGVPPTVNFEGEVMELTTTEDNSIDNVVTQVRRIIDRDMNEQDFDSPEFSKKLMGLCLKYAKADKRTAKKAFQKILQNLSK